MHRPRCSRSIRRSVQADRISPRIRSIFSSFHASRNLIPKLWLSADAYYSYGGETRVDGVAQGNSANTLRLGAGAGVTVWSGGDVMLNYEKVVAKPAGQPDAQTFRLKLRQAW